MGKVIVGVVAFAILSFILADLLGPNSFFFGRDNNVGQIGGEKISFEEYQQQVDQFASNYAANFGRNPSEREMVTLRNQAWEIMIVDYAFKKQYAELGVEVGEEEQVDLVQGKNISPEITNAPIFVNQETGIFDREILAAFLANFGSQPPALQQQWLAFESNLTPARRRIKYENLLNKSTYVTQAEARKEYVVSNTSANLKYLYVPFGTVSDTLVNVTDADLEAYLNAHKEEYKVNASKEISFVTFPVIPSADDTAFFRMDLEDVKREFATVTDDSIFAKINSDGSNFIGTYAPKQLPSSLHDLVSELTEGEVYGPFLDRDAFKIHKVLQVVEDTIWSARAKHILFKWADESASAKVAARSEANRVLNDIRNGADFGEMAQQYGTDGTAVNGGDLGWFPQADMVKPFSDAVFATTRTGLIPQLVETEFGYHIISVTNTKMNKQFKVATIDRTIIPSDETTDKAFRQADYFAGTNTNFTDFTSAAEQEGLQVRTAEKIEASQTNIAGIGNAREIVRWLFTEANRNEVSEVFELDDSYVIVVMTNEVEEGTADLESVELQVRRAVINERKAEYIIEQLESLSGTVDEMAAAYGAGANVYSTEDLKQNAASIPNVGAAPEAIGVIFASESGTTTAPLRTRSGVMVATIESLTPATEIADYALFRNQLESSREGRTSYYISEAIKKSADIVDERYKFF